MIKILAFCFFPAFVPPSNGGQSRLFNLYRALSHWCHVTLVTSTHIGVHEEVIQHGLNFVERRIPKDNYFVQQWANLERFSSGGDLSGPTIAACGRLPTLLHQAYLEEYEKADVIFHDFPFNVNYDLFAGVDQKPRIYNAHNCETLLYRQLHPGEKSKPIHDLVCATEKNLLQKTDLVLYCNENDLETLRLLAPNTTFDTLYTPNGMTPAHTCRKTLEKLNNTFHAVFMGSGHPPNVLAAEFIIDTLAPAFPNIVFDIIGSCLPEGNYPSNLIRHGVVDDATKLHLLSQADIALNPMAAGSGSNVKVLEYFAYGIPVLSTSFGMRGIHAHAGEHYLDATLDNFSQALEQAISSISLLVTIGDAGQELVLERYNWAEIVKPVVDRISALACIKKQIGCKRFILALNDYDSFSGIGGGATRTRGLYNVVKDWCPVVFVCFSDDNSIGARNHGKDITVINVPKMSEHIAEIDFINAQFHISANDIIASRHCKANPWLNSIYRVLRQSARNIVIEHCYLVDLPLTWGDCFVYSSHNNETNLKSSLLEWHPLKSELVADVERIERLAVEHSVATIAVSREDAESLMKGKRTAGPVIVVTNGASSPLIGAKVEKTKNLLRDRIGTHSVVFLGSAHMPNVEAAQFIVDQLATQCPNIQFHLVGSVCSAIQPSSANVILWGVVDEITKSAILQSCHLALNPMDTGSGSNVKLADYIGNGLFVVSTEFGQRGYPASVHDHIAIVSKGGFVERIIKALNNPNVATDEARADRRALFERELSMSVIAKRFVETLQNIEKPKKRVLFVTYRYTSPSMGGAEAHIEKFVNALGRSGMFDVDVVAPEISDIHNYMRFSECYSFDPESGVPVDMPNVRFARFPTDTPNPEQVAIQLRKAWAAQPSFERAVDEKLQKQYQESGLTWGWGYPECVAGSIAKWAFAECGLFLHKASQIDIDGYTSYAAVITVYSEETIIAGPWSIEGVFSLTFQAGAGNLRFVTSVQISTTDPRPLAIRVTGLKLNGSPFNLASENLIHKYLATLPAAERFHLLDQAARSTRFNQGVSLTDGRGPWSYSLERYIADHVSDYDLVVTNNNVFRPAVIAIDEAQKQGVPSILIPHAHLDDDFYHFPDCLGSARNASLVLAVPKAACDFLTENGCNVSYLPAGCDASEQFTAADQKEFRQIHPSPRPFILVLGRKAGAKGYKKIIEAVEKLNSDGITLQVVLIGPDDDGIAVDSPNAIYLGRQSRNIVRGALMSCLALCNMSRSESFGIVLLEAWMAGKPVIANNQCAAFHDMAVDGENAYLTNEISLRETIVRLINEPETAERLAANGRKLIKQFDWDVVSASFTRTCIRMAKKNDTNNLESISAECS